MCPICGSGKIKRRPTMNKEPLIEANSKQQDDYIDWSKVHVEFVFCTVGGQCGEIQLWRNNPVLLLDRWTSSSEIFQMIEEEDCLDAIIGPLPPWRDSLRKRPEK
jgi:hypothetical protein